MRIGEAVGATAWWGVFLVVLLLSWLTTPGGYWPAGYPDVMGWLAAGFRGAWFLLAPWWALWAVALSARWGSARALPALTLGVAATPAVLAWWPAGALVVAQLANLVWMLLLFVALVPVAFVVSLFG